MWSGSFVAICEWHWKCKQQISRSGDPGLCPIPHVAHFTVLLLYSITLNIVCLYPERRGNIMYHDVHPKQASRQVGKPCQLACFFTPCTYLRCLFYALRT